MMNRVQREKAVFNDLDVLIYYFRLQSRFWHVFHCPNSILLEKYFEKVIAANTPNSYVLDLGCLNGDFYNVLSRYNPKHIVGIDISDIGINKAKQNYGKFAEYHVMDAHKMEFESETFDVIVGTAILHHLDWLVAIHEIKRVLKTGGIAAFLEPLGNNPAGKFIRKITHKARSRDESPLSKSQILMADKIIGNPQHKFANLISVPLAMITSRFCKEPDNILLRFANKIDLALAKTSVKYWMRIGCIVWRRT